MAYSHCRIRTRIQTRTRTPSLIVTLYYAEVFTLVQIRTQIPVRTDSRIVTVPILGADLYPNKPVHTTFSCFLGGLSLHSNHLIASCMTNYDWPFGTLSFGLFWSNLDTKDLETYPRTYSGHF